MSEEMKKVGETLKNKIGWKHFTEGKLKLAIELRSFQHESTYFEAARM